MRRPAAAAAVALVVLGLGGPPGGAPAAAAGPGVWEGTPPPAVPIARAGHTATLLPNGRVLIAGGQGDNYKALASAVVYDPANRSWSATATTLALGRFDHSATLVPSTGLVVVAGGVVGPPGESRTQTNSVETYDYRTNAWSSGGALLAARANHTATPLPGGHVLVVGGKPDQVYLESLKTSELYDSGSRTSAPGPELTEGRWGHTATLTGNGGVLVVGGHEGRNHDTEPEGPLALPELYAGGSWGGATAGLADPLVLRRLFHSATRLDDGSVLVAGGQHGNASVGVNSVVRFDGSGWTAARQMQGQREHHTATLLTDGRLLVTGGLAPGPQATSPPVPLRTTELFDPGSGSWSSAGVLAKPPRAGARAALLAGTSCAAACGRVLVVGGVNGDPVSGAAYLASTDSYIPAPVVTAIGPGEGPTGRSVTIEGFGLASVTEVRFEEAGRTVGVQCAKGSTTGCAFDPALPDGRVQVGVPTHEPGRATWSVTVVTDGGTATRQFAYTYDNVQTTTTVAPVLPRENPAAGPSRAPQSQGAPPAAPPGATSAAPAPAGAQAPALDPSGAGAGATGPTSAGNVPAAVPASSPTLSAPGQPAVAQAPASSAGVHGAPAAAGGTVANPVFGDTEPAPDAATRYGMQRAASQGIPTVAFAGAALLMAFTCALLIAGDRARAEANEGRAY